MPTETSRRDKLRYLANVIQNMERELPKDSDSLLINPDYEYHNNHKI